MESNLDRRVFLRRAAVAAVAASPLSLFGCRVDGDGTAAADDARAAAGNAGADGALPGATPRPILLPWGSDAVLIAAPPRERPVAYMSMRRMEIYIDREFRDRLHYALNAHISVSTGVWRVPLPGDPLTVPVTPGDAEREFEEIDMRYWNAELEPAEGDLRVMRGAPQGVTVGVPCVPLSGGGVWLTGGPWEVAQCGPPSDQLCREDLMEIGVGLRYADRDCTRPAGQVRFVTWACREPAILAGV